MILSSYILYAIGTIGVLIDQQSMATISAKEVCDNRNSTGDEVFA